MKHSAIYFAIRDYDGDRIRIKIGETTQTATARERSSNREFSIVSYLDFEELTDCQRLMLESYVRLRIERSGIADRCGTDTFYVPNVECAKYLHKDFLENINELIKNTMAQNIIFGEKVLTSYKKGTYNSFIGSDKCIEGLCELAMNDEKDFTNWVERLRIEFGLSN